VGNAKPYFGILVVIAHPAGRVVLYPENHWVATDELFHVSLEIQDFYLVWSIFFQSDKECVVNDFEVTLDLVKHVLQSLIIRVHYALPFFEDILVEMVRDP
jgi:hypothetical protein